MYEAARTVSSCRNIIKVKGCLQQALQHRAEHAESDPGFSQAKASNMTGSNFAPAGARGIFNGASLLFFSYVGFDAISTTAEEVGVAF